MQKKLTIFLNHGMSQLLKAYMYNLVLLTTYFVELLASFYFSCCFLQKSSIRQLAYHVFLAFVCILFNRYITIQCIKGKRKEKWTQYRGKWVKTREPFAFFYCKHIKKISINSPVGLHRAVMQVAHAQFTYTAVIFNGLLPDRNNALYMLFVIRSSGEPSCSTCSIYVHMWTVRHHSHNLPRAPSID